MVMETPELPEDLPRLELTLTLLQLALHQPAPTPPLLVV
jgi:hypothetical protein